MALIPRWVGVAYLAAAAALWGGMYVVSSWALTQVPLLALLWLRYAVALCSLGIYGLAARRSFALRRSQLRLATIMGVVGLGIAAIAQLGGTVLAGAAWASVATAAAPGAMVLLAARRAATFRWPGLMVGLLAIGVVLAGAPAGAAVILLAAAGGWAWASVAASRIPARDQVFPVTWAALVIATLLLAPVAAVTWHPSATTWSWGLVWAVLYSGLAGTAAALWLWSRGVMLAGPAGGATAFFAQPLVGIVLGAWLLGEPISIALLAAAAILLAATRLLARSGPSAARPTIMLE